MAGAPGPTFLPHPLQGQWPQGHTHPGLYIEEHAGFPPLLALHQWASLSRFPLPLHKHIQAESLATCQFMLCTHSSPMSTHHTHRCHHIDRSPQPPEAPSSSHTCMLMGTQAQMGSGIMKTIRTTSPPPQGHTDTHDPRNALGRTQAHPDTQQRLSPRLPHTISQTQAHPQHPSFKQAPLQPTALYRVYFPFTLKGEQGSKS